jgi:hypothetical protein
MWRSNPCIKGVAKLHYTKDDKRKSCQKTWIARGEVFDAKLAEVEVAFKAEVRRWEIQTLEQIKNGERPELKQVEHLFPLEKGE